MKLSGLTIKLCVDGEEYQLQVAPRKLLAHTLRDDLDITSLNIGCDTSQCGACTIEVDGEAVKSCTVLAVQADGCEITTAASLADGAKLSGLQQAFQQAHALQCGYCTPGMLISATSLLRETPSPDEAQVREALKGNLCRCTGYQNIVEAVLIAAGASTLKSKIGD